MKSKTIVFSFLFILTLNTLSAQTLATKSVSSDTTSISEKTTYKIVFQMSTKDTLAHKALIKQLNNIKSVAPSTKIKIVCHGPGLEMLIKNKTTVMAGIQLATVKGVEFVACEFSLKERKIEKSEIVPEAGFVAAGILEIVKLQHEDWFYIKSGF